MEEPKVIIIPKDKNEGMNQEHKDILFIVFMFLLLVIVAVYGYFYIQNIQAVTLHPCAICMEQGNICFGEPIF